MSKNDNKKDLKNSENLIGGMPVILTIKENGNFTNLYIETANHTKVWVRLGEFNSKLLYKLKCECKEYLEKFNDPDNTNK